MAHNNVNIQITTLTVVISETFFFCDFIMFTTLGYLKHIINIGFNQVISSFNNIFELIFFGSEYY